MYSPIDIALRFKMASVILTLLHSSLKIKVDKPCFEGFQLKSVKGGDIRYGEGWMGKVGVLREVRGCRPSIGG